MLKPKRGTGFGSRLDVEVNAIYVDSQSSAARIAANGAGANSGLQNTALLGASREYGYTEFIITGQVTFTDLNASGVVTLIPASSPPQAALSGVQAIPEGQRCYITDIAIACDSVGAAGGTNVSLQDNNSSPVTYQTIALAQLGANAVWVLGQTGTPTAALVTGGTASKGLQWVGTGAFTGAGYFNYCVKGYFAP